MKPIVLFTIITVVMMSSCRSRQKADMLLYNGVIYTADSVFSVAEALVVKDGNIVAVGETEELKSLYEATETSNLNGHFVYPGFMDAHCHFYGFALTLQQADLNGAADMDEVLERLKKHHEAFHSGWLIGRGWDQNLWPEKQFPDNRRLDEWFPDIPVAITRIDGHVILANSCALKVAGFGPGTKISGGVLEVKEGKLTGILMDKAADKLKELIPQPLGEELQELLAAAENKCLGCGLTTVADAGLSRDIVLLIESMLEQEKLRMSYYVMLDPSDENMNHFVKNGIYKKQKLHAGAIKLYADGALGSRGACLLQPYSDRMESKGIMVEHPDTLRKYCRIAYDNHYQVCVHAIGDSAVRTVLDIYSEFLGGKNDRRWRVEHAQVVQEDDFGKFGSFNIIPSVQPTHATSDMYWAESRLGEKRIRNAYAYKKLLLQNGWLPTGTDFPIEKIDPLLTFYAAVSRKDVKGFPENGFQTENALTREEALRSMTIWAAKSLFEEKEKGSLEPGKRADFVILDRDIMKVGENEILNARIEKVYISGSVVFQDKVVK